MEAARAAGVVDEQIDYWGIRNRQVCFETGTYWEQVFHPLAFVKTRKDLDDYRWLNPDWFDYSGLKQRAREVRERHVVESDCMANNLQSVSPVENIVATYNDAERYGEILRTPCGIPAAAAPLFTDVHPFAPGPTALTVSKVI